MKICKDETSGSLDVYLFTIIQLERLLDFASPYSMYGFASDMAVHSSKYLGGKEGKAGGYQPQFSAKLGTL